MENNMLCQIQVMCCLRIGTSKGGLIGDQKVCLNMAKKDQFYCVHYCTHEEKISCLGFTQNYYGTHQPHPFVAFILALVVMTPAVPAL